MEREGSERSPLRRKIYRELTESDGRVFEFIASKVWSEREAISRKKSVNKWKNGWAKKAIDLTKDMEPFSIPSGEGEMESREIAAYLRGLSILQIRGTRENREADLASLSSEALRKVEDDQLRNLLLKSASYVLSEYVVIDAANRNAVSVRVSGANKEK